MNILLPSLLHAGLHPHILRLDDMAIPHVHTYSCYHTIVKYLSKLHVIVVPNLLPWIFLDSDTCSILLIVYTLDNVIHNVHLHLYPDQWYTIMAYQNLVQCMIQTDLAFQQCPQLT